MDTWYYVDTARNRQGPVSAEAVAAAFQAGAVHDDSLVWREGLAQWAPLRQFRDELGMGPATTPVGAAPPPPAQEAAAADKKKNGCLVPAVIIGGVGIVLLALLGILAAIALPAYQDYVIRSKLVQALSEGRFLAVAVEEHLQTEGRCPTSFEELGAREPDLGGTLSVTLVSLGEDRCVIEVAVEGLHTSDALSDRRLYLTREEGGRYVCSSDIEQDRYLPSGCR